MPILNYTTTVTASRTAGEIQERLAKAGAKAVLCEYDDSGISGIMCAMSFRIATKHGLVSFRMPANTGGVLKVLTKDPKVPKRLKTQQQAANVAWRVIKDWVDAQLAMVQARVRQVLR